jgi:copper resistance protein C
MAAVALAGPALAHAELVTSDPADKAQLDTPPTTVTLDFSETLDGSKSSFKLVGPDGSTIGTGGMTGPKEMTLAGLTLAPGAYAIRWTSASAEDGDIARGELSFTVLAAAPSPSAAASASAPPSAGAASPSPAPTVAPSAPPAPTPTPSADSQQTASTGSGVLVPIIVAVLIVAGIGAWVIRRGRAA